MEIGTFRGLVTAVLMLLFVALVLWAYSRSRRKTFDELARMPLEDDRAPAPRAEGKQHRAPVRADGQDRRAPAARADGNARRAPRPDGEGR